MLCLAKPLERAGRRETPASFAGASDECFCTSVETALEWYGSCLRDIEEFYRIDIFLVFSGRCKMIDCLKNPWRPEVRGYVTGRVSPLPESKTGSVGIDLPIRKLATAILVQALKDVLREKETRIVREEALSWFFSSNRQPGSFHWVSEVMQADGETFRDRIRSDLMEGGKRRSQLADRIRKSRLLRPE